MTIPIRLACGAYDRTRALIDGSVRPEGVRLELVVMDDAFARHDRMIREEAFDVCELSMSSYLMARERGRGFIAIPVFPYRMFRHGYVLINRRSGVSRPQDLVGKRMGVPMYQMTAAVWVRGHLQHEYGVAPQQMRWVTDRDELVGFRRANDLQIEVAPPGSSLEAMLVAGDLDALIMVEEVPEALLQQPDVGRLFPNYAQVERELYQRTGIYPIMHALVARCAVLDAHPWLATSLMRAFQEAKERALDELRYPRTSTLVWAGTYREQERAVFGWDPHPYGLEPNRPTLEALATYSFEQGLTTRRHAVDELFVQA